MSILVLTNLPFHTKTIYPASRSDYRMVQNQVACIYFNSLPEHIRNCTNFKHFSKDTFNYLFNQVYNVDST